MSDKPRIIKIDELPDRLAHLRKTAERIKLDHPEPMTRIAMLMCPKKVTA